MDSIKRIKEMEAIFDELLDKVDQINNDPLLKAKYQQLVDYYSSSLWLEDYELDCQKKLPTNLKRGILSEDGIYNLIFVVENSLVIDE